MTAPETITRDELEAVLTRCLRTATRITFAGEPGSIAADLFAEARRQREPEWQHGDVVKDAKGDVWWWNGYGNGGWDAPGVSGQVGADVPARPLRKLVPLPFHDDLVAVLVESITHDVSGYEGQAQRVLKLLEGGSDD